MGLRKFCVFASKQKKFFKKIRCSRIEHNNTLKTLTFFLPQKSSEKLKKKKRSKQALSSPFFMGWRVFLLFFLMERKMKKFVFGVFVLLSVGLFTNPLFAKKYETPDCATGCNFMGSCNPGSPNSIFDIYDCSGRFTAVAYNGNCRWDVKMNDNGQFILNGNVCRPY